MAVVGDKVTFVDEVGVEHDALITQRWDGVMTGSEDDIDPRKTINLVYVTSDPKETDQYGWQIRRQASVQGEASGVTAHGRFWRE